MIRMIDWRGAISRGEVNKMLEVPAGTVAYQIDGKPYVPVEKSLNRAEKVLNKFSFGFEAEVTLVGLTTRDEELETRLTQTYTVGAEYEGKGRIDLSLLDKTVIVSSEMRRRLSTREHIMIKNCSGEPFAGIC